MNDNANTRFKNFLVNGFQGLEPREDGDEWNEEPATEEAEVPEGVPEEAPHERAPHDADPETLKSIESELIRIRYMLEDLSTRTSDPVDMSRYLTTREQAKAMDATVSRLESSASNKAMLRAMEQVSTMREDFLRLCRDMRARIDEMDAETVLSSFEAYSVDMENILTDGGVYIGRFDHDRLNTLHQRIVGVVPTGEKEKDGTIAERQSDGYKLGDKVLLKERVTVYKFDPSVATEECPEVEQGNTDEEAVDSGPEEALETVSETSSVDAEDSVEEAPDSTEEKE